MTSSSAQTPVRAARGRLTRAMLAGLRFTHLIGPGFRIFERWQAFRFNRRRDTDALAPDGLPLPPQRLVVLVAGPVTPERFLAKGRIGADTVRGALARQGVEIGKVSDLLDFGVGCGRVARHWKDLGAAKVHGCDINPELVRWTAANLPFVDARVSSLAPPLAYTDAAFDVVYAFSVFTHLPDDLQQAWAEEMARVVRPGGHLIISTHGAAYLDRLSADEQAAFDAARLVVHFEELSGSNLCSAFHSTALVERQFAGAFALVESIAKGAPSNGLQDLHVLRRA